MTGMDDLVTWLRAQLDEDERVARASQAIDPGPWVNRVHAEPGGYNTGRIIDDGGYTVIHVEDQTPEFATAEHITRWDPARVLGLILGLRAILSTFSWEAQETRAIQILAEALYADRPGYLEIWRA